MFLVLSIPNFTSIIIWPFVVLPNISVSSVPCLLFFPCSNRCISTSSSTSHQRRQLRDWIQLVTASASPEPLGTPPRAESRSEDIKFGPQKNDYHPNSVLGVVSLPVRNVVRKAIAVDEVGKTTIAKKVDRNKAVLLSPLAPAVNRYNIRLVLMALHTCRDLRKSENFSPYISLFASS